MSLSDFASQTSERHNVPEIEAQSSPEVLLTPLTVSRNENEKVFIEPSINSVRISIRIKQADEIEHILVHKFTRFLTQRAESFFILRRKPVKGYDISFLITNFHTEEMLKHKLVDFIIQFMEEVDKEISEMKLFLNARARFVAESFLTPGVIEVVDLAQSVTSNTKHNSVSPVTATVSPGKRTIWSATTASLAERLSDMNPSKGLSAWGHPEFIPQTPLGEDFPPLQQAHTVPRHNQKGGQQFSGRGPALSGFSQSPGQHIRSKSGATSYAAAVWATPTHMRGNKRLVPQARDPDDPFVDNDQDNRSGEATNYKYTTPSSDTRKVSQRDDPVTPSSRNNNKKEHESSAAQLAQIIRSGAFDNDTAPASLRPNRAPSNRSPLHRPLAEPAHGAMVLHNNLANIQPLVVPDTVPEPPFFAALSRGYRPTVEEAFEHIPFTEEARHAKSNNHGVIKISNIPYGTTKNEIVAAVGRSARLVNQPAGTPYYAIHIIMERSTGKTMDCFVELETNAEASILYNNFQGRCMNGRHPRLGDRQIDFEFSSQQALMKELFPRAKCVRWDGQVPTVYETDEPYNSGFRGFLTGEELVMVQKHAETPQRSPFAQRCHNRTYESLISTLHKYPWFAIDSVTIHERTALFNATMVLLRVLALALRRGISPTMLTRSLLQELVIAALATPGFNHQQRAMICDNVSYHGFADTLQAVPNAHLGVLGGFWAFEVLAKKPNVSVDVLAYYVSLLREATTASPSHFTLAQRSAFGDLYDPASPFGNMYVDYGGDRAKLSLADAALAEWNVVEELLRRVLPSGKSLVIQGGQ
ncbi:hypothetical protein MBLNU459_g2971t1 [Dothideomycetes sp. NU459]